MSFLSAAFLLALPLVAVPVAIHLYRGRQRDVIMWGAMQFLAAAVTKGRRMERLEEWLLMALRFAVGVLHGPLQVGSHGFHLLGRAFVLFTRGGVGDGPDEVAATINRTCLRGAGRSCGRGERRPFGGPRPGHSACADTR